MYGHSLCCFIANFYFCVLALSLFLELSGQFYIERPSFGFCETSFARFVYMFLFFAFEIDAAIVLLSSYLFCTVFNLDLKFQVPRVSTRRRNVTFSQEDVSSGCGGTDVRRSLEFASPRLSSGRRHARTGSCPEVDVVVAAEEANVRKIEKCLSARN